MLKGLAEVLLFTVYLGVCIMDVSKMHLLWLAFIIKLMKDSNTIYVKKYQWTKSIRHLNLAGAILWGLSVISGIDTFRFLGAYFFAYCYVWLFLLFVVFEIRFIILTKSNLLKHLVSNRIVLFGLFAPLLIFILHWGW